jgi:succinoglycan biosynthesis protein ExoW
MKHLAVIIPFYQKKSGLLLNAVNSIFKQNNIDGLKITIIIVDDESPIKPDKELLNIEPVIHIDIQTIHQKNAGPAKARNVGLDLADALNVDFIAFLDSDDIWHSDHIHRALLCLGGISEFYFCDHQRFDDEESYFNVEVDISEFIKKRKLNNSLFITIDSELFFSHLIENYACQTSTIVFSHKILNGLRFDESLELLCHYGFEIWC